MVECRISDLSSSLLYTQCKANLSYMRPSPEKKKEKKNPRSARNQKTCIRTCVRKESFSHVRFFPVLDASSIEANEDMEIAYPITCGESKAVLLWKKFVCPGINVKCVKVIVSCPEVWLQCLISLPHQISFCREMEDSDPGSRTS